MLKKTAIELLGGSPVKAAKAMGYKSPHAIYVWPDELTTGLTDKVNGALLRIRASAPQTTAESAQPAAETVAGQGA